MKRRFIIALTILIALMAAYAILRIVLPPSTYALIDLLSLFVVIFDVIYLWFGIPRLIVYIIYAAFMLPALYFFPEKYHILLIFLFTIIIVLNPLAGFEHMMIKNLKDKYTKVLDYVPRGRYKTYYQYKDEMKSHYHLPQFQKFYTKRSYRMLSTISILILFFSLIFLLLTSSSDIVIGEGWNSRSFITLYLAILFTIALIILYKKGFVSTSRVFKIGIFPLGIVILSVLSYNIVVKILLVIGLSLGFIAVIISETIRYHLRVVYSSYHYYDPQEDEHVWANALYEQFAKSEGIREMKLIEFKMPEELFHKQFKTLLVFTNFYKTIITAYTIKRGTVNLYIEYYKEKTIDRVKKRIEKIYNVEITSEAIVTEKEYEEKFLQNHEYIIAKTIKLSNLLIELDIEAPVIVSVFMRFNNVEAAQPLAKQYKTQLLENETDYCLVESSITVENLDYLIETNLRNLLLEMLINGGT